MHCGILLPAVNNENHEGAVGFISLLVPGILPLGLIKIDEETGRALRGPDGLCIPCQPGEEVGTRVEIPLTFFSVMA